MSTLINSSTISYGSGGRCSSELLERAIKVIPGGVNSPVRAFRQVGGDPLFIAAGDGAYVIDVDGQKYIDYVASWGPHILGHNSHIVKTALINALERGTSFGAPTEIEVEFAEFLTDIIPGLEMVRFVSSGTEATMTAIRLARGFTGRDLLLKFNGCYHGHADSLLIESGSGLATLGIPASSGVPSSIAELTVSVEFNNFEMFSDLVNRIGSNKFAAVIIEPVPGNMGLVLPKPDFLSELRKFCNLHGIVLIFDEVMSGFRVALGGAQEVYSVNADLVTFGKVIGGGLPVGALGGRAEIMKHLAPIGSVYQAGTLSGNPLAMTAGLAVVRHLREHNPYPFLNNLAQRWVVGMKQIAEEFGIQLVAENSGSMIGFFFSASPVTNFTEAKKSDINKFKRFFHGMLKRGIYLAPSAFEAGFISTAHNEDLIDQTVLAAKEVLAELT